MNEQIPVKQKIVSEQNFKISRMKQKIKATHPHKHDHYHELIFLTAGTGFHTIDLKRYQVEPPQLFLVKAGQVHHWEFTSIPKGYVLIFRSDFLVHLASSDTLSGFEQLHNPSFNLDKSKVRTFETIFEQMYKEFEDRNQQYNRIIASFLEILLARLIRLAHNAQQDPTEPAQKLVDRYQQLIHKHFTEYHLVKDYAKQMHISPKHLNEACTSVTNKTAGEILTDSIMLEAKRRLLYSSNTVAEIGYAMGFSDPSNFSAFFKHHTNTPPGAFRESML